MKIIKDEKKAREFNRRWQKLQKISAESELLEQTEKDPLDTAGSMILQDHMRKFKANKEYREKVLADYERITGVKIR